MKEQKDTIELGLLDAAIVVRADGGVEMHIPDADEVPPGAQLLTAIGIKILRDQEWVDHIWNWWNEQIDMVKDEADGEDGTRH